MSDRIKTQRASRRRRTTRRVNRRPVRVSDVDASKVPGVDSSVPSGKRTAAVDEPKPVGEVELTDDMALLVGRLTSPDNSEADNCGQEPAVVVAPPMRLVGDPSDPPPPPRHSAPPDRPGGQPSEEELTIDEGDVEESYALDQREESSRIKTPPPPPPAQGKTRPPPPPKPQQPKKQPWWETFFSEDYLLTHVPPEADQVSRQCDFYWDSLALKVGSTVLDVGCGLGLHAVELARRGCLVVGIDLSLPMITRAAELAQESNLRINFLHSDIRDIGFEGTFDAVLCAGTTFGFFSDEDNEDVLRRMYEALKPGGRLLVDVLNRDQVLPSQPNLVWFQGDGCLCMEETDFNYETSRLVLKRTLMKEGGEQSDVEYTLRLYAYHELVGLFKGALFRVLEVSGQEATKGAFFGCHSTRMLVLGGRPGEPKSISPPRPSAP